VSDYGDAIAEVQIALGAEASDLFPYVATVNAVGGVTNLGDGTYEETQTSAAGVPCNYEPLRPFEKVVGGAVQAQADYALEFPVYWDGAHLSIPPNASVTVSAGAVMPARTFQVTGPLPSSSVWKQRVAATLRP